MSIAFVFGTRPEILKVYPLIKEAEENNIKTIIIHTNQHYSHEMDQVFFEELKLRTPDYNLEVGSAPHNIQLSKMLLKLDTIFTDCNPDCVIVQGDTNSTLAGAIAANKRGIKVAHVEAGLRSYDRNMPEEINRIITDSISDYLFPVTKVQENILVKENISKEKIFTVGNTIVDTLHSKIRDTKTNLHFLETLDLKASKFSLLTMHRPSNVDNTETLMSLAKSLDIIAKSNDFKFIWPIHPRTEAKIKNEKLVLPDTIQLTSPKGYLDFLTLMSEAKFIFTDSGGIQEEACIIKKPCLTLRFNTERPETIEVGANKLVDHNIDKMQEAIDYFNSLDSFNWSNPFGDGNTSQKIINIIQE